MSYHSVYICSCLLVHGLVSAMEIASQFLIYHGLYSEASGTGQTNVSLLRGFNPTLEVRKLEVTTDRTDPFSWSFVTKVPLLDGIENSHEQLLALAK
ncbi:hypothetical protein QR685DRAFT_517323 [Neurospora intermedia]|uniref:Uncharacterized protein n=1 Tax=Neurospora intermedia TaxID=5142 RepID=A0ABR3DLS1_NEUIN